MPRKTETFTAPLHSGDSITRGKLTLTATIEPDSDSGTPWDNSDCHGPVSDWTSRDKEPGELILCDDNPSGLRGTKNRRYYNMQSAVHTARADEWGSLHPYKLRLERTRNGSHVAIATAWNKPDIASKPRRDINRAIRELYDIYAATFPSKRAYHANAAQADYDYLRQWCDDQWSYVGIIVTATDTRTGIELASASLWGIESHSADYLAEVANDLTTEAIADANQTRASLTDGSN